MAKTKTAGVEGQTTEPAKRCAVTRKQWATDAPATITLTINGTPVVASKKEFASGGYGYYTNEKVTIMIGDIPLKLQSNCCLTAVNSAHEPK